MPPSSRLGFNRRASNEIAGSVQIEQLRALQNQLSSMIKDADLSDSARSTTSRPRPEHGGVPAVTKRLDSARFADARLTAAAERTLLRDDAADLEAGDAPPAPRQAAPPTPQSYDVDEADQDEDDDLPVTFRTGSRRPSWVRMGADAIAESDHAIAEAIENNKSEASLDFFDETPLTIPLNLSLTTRDNEEAQSRRIRWFHGKTSQIPGEVRKSSLKSKLDSSQSSWKSKLDSSVRTLNKPKMDSSLKSRLDSSVRTLNRRCNGAWASKPKLNETLHRLPSYDFLQKDDEEKEGGSLLPGAGAKWWHAVFGFSLISVLACVVTLWAPYPVGARMPTAMVAETPWSDGCEGLQSCICPRATICADDLVSMVYLTVARCTAWFDYPLYMLLFLSKANNLNNFLQKTALRCWINFSDFHRVHSLFGIVVGVESASHSFFHLLRWSRRNNDMQLLWTTRTGVTGLVAITLVPFIVLPMTVPYLKKRMPYEWRKGLHYLSVVWGAALMWHAPERIYFLIGIPLFVYITDKMVEGLFKTHLVESAHFQRLGDTSCLISFENPPGFGKQNSAYVYLMLPWLSKCQFHAFTVFPDTKPNHSSVCIHKCGGWTQQLMDAVTTPTHKPAFVVGPFLSPFSSPAMDSENLMAVASGIGVTPAISLIKQYANTHRRLNLVWICREPGLVEHFLQNVDFGSDGYTLIYYTGKERALILREDLPSNVLIFNERPDLERTLSGIITSIATGEGLPEELHKKVLTRTPADKRSKLLLEKALSIYTMDQLYEFTAKASDHHNRGVESLVDVVNYDGVRSTMKHLLGEDCMLVCSKITENFEMADISGNGHLDREGFEEFFYLMLDKQEELTSSMVEIKRGLQQMTTARDLFQNNGRVPKSAAWEDEFEIKRHLQGEGKFAARNWNMLYCGGSQPVVDQLKAFKRKFGIGLSVEKFDW